METSPAYNQVAEYLNHLERFGIKPGLERIRALMERFGNPHLKYPVVLVGGTNGKGSTVEFIASILRCAGYKVGVYTSPHIYRYSERIRLLSPSPPTPLPPAGEGGGNVGLYPGEIPDDDLLRLLNTVRPVAEDIERTTELGGATTFETLTAMAFIYFAEQKVDIAIVEVGLGGRWDATNITEPIISVITNVSLDHTDRLGDTVEKIAREKVEIVRPGRVLVTGERNPEAFMILEDVCRQRKVTLNRVLIPALQTTTREVADPLELKDTIFKFPLETFGSYQHFNVSLAIETVAELKRLGWRANSTAIGLALREPSVPVRFECVQESPFLLLDGANNTAGIAELANAVARFRDAILRRHHLVLVLGISADKAVEEMVSIIAPRARTVIATQAQHKRAAPAERIAEAARRHCSDVRVAVSVRDAVRQALSLAGEHDLVLITGSFFVLGEVDRDELASLPKPRG